MFLPWRSGDGSVREGIFRILISKRRFPKPPPGGLEANPRLARPPRCSPCKYFHKLHDEQGCNQKIFVVFIYCIIAGLLCHPLGDSLTSNFHLFSSAAAAAHVFPQSDGPTLG